MNSSEIANFVKSAKMYTYENIYVYSIYISSTDFKTAITSYGDNT